MSTTTEQEIPYVVRRRLEQAGVPFSLLWGSPAVYLAAWSEARRNGKSMSVSAACQAAGFSPDALRQRRRHNPTFAAAERCARTGQPYVAPDAPETIKAVDHAPREVDFSDPARAGYPLPLAVIPPGAKLRSTSRRRDNVPMWAGGTGYEDLGP